MPLPEIHLSSLAYTAGHYLEREGHIDGAPKFDLEAPYQRGSVWTLHQRRALVKSLLMGLPVGSVIVAHLPYKAGRAPYRVVDGRQRIEAIRAFCAGGLAVPSEWWRTHELVEGHTDEWVGWTGLAQPGQLRFENSTVAALEFDPSVEWIFDPSIEGRPWRTRRRSDAEMLVAEAELYGLVNGGGTAQTAEDMARAAAVVARHQP